MTADLTRPDELSVADCLRLIDSRSFGRIGLSIGALPMILPVLYVVDEDAVLLRTDRAAHSSTAIDGSVVAFEVGELDHHTETGWSVVVRGVAHGRNEPTAPSVRDSSRLSLDPSRHQQFSLSMDLVSGHRFGSSPNPLGR